MLKFCVPGFRAALYNHIHYMFFQPIIDRDDRWNTGTGREREIRRGGGRGRQNKHRTERERETVQLAGKEGKIKTETWSVGEVKRKSL